MFFFGRGIKSNMLLLSHEILSGVFGKYRTRILVGPGFADMNDKTILMNAFRKKPILPGEEFYLKTMSVVMPSASHAQALADNINQLARYVASHKKHPWDCPYVFNAALHSKSDDTYHAVIFPSVNEENPMDATLTYLIRAHETELKITMASLLSKSVEEVEEKNRAASDKRFSPFAKYGC